MLQLFIDRGYRLISARVVTDKYSGQFRGFGFVELGQGDDMARAIGELDGLDVEGRAINVSEACPQEFRGGGSNGSGGGGHRSGGGGGRGCSGRRSEEGHRGHQSFLRSAR